MKHIETIIPYPDYPKTHIERYEKHTVFFLHYTADENKRSKKWYEDERAKYFAQGKSEEAWEQDYEISFDKTGLPRLFPSYDPKVHERDIEYDPFLPIIRGWDFGYAFPAVVFMQHDKKVDQIKILDAMMLEDCDIDEFATQVLDHCEEHFKPGRHNGIKYPIKYRDFCDHSGNEKRDLGTTTKILRGRYGIRPKSRPSKPEERAKLIRNWLRLRKNGTPGMVVNRKCAVITEGFRGAWASKKDLISGLATGMPVKDNFYEHTRDALGYAMDMLFGAQRDPALAKDRKRRARKQRQELHRRYIDSVTGYSFG